MISVNTIGSSFLQAAYAVLLQEKRPLGVQELTRIAQQDGFLSDSRRGGLTPSQTMKSKLSVHIRKNGDQSLFIRQAPGLFYLRELVEPGQIVFDAPRFRISHPREHVHVFSQEHLDNLGRFQGINPGWKPYFDSIAFGPTCRAIDRMAAEIDDSLKQVLTYVIVRRANGSLLGFQRGEINRVDDSLRGMHAIGFGGHVGQRDLTLFAPNVDEIGLFNNAARELTEELRFHNTEEQADLLERPEEYLSIVAVLNDDSSPNGKRHFAFILEYQVRNDEDWQFPECREKSINRVRWINAEEVASTGIHRFEYWSQLCLRLYEKIGKETPSYRVRRKTAFRNASILCLVGQIGSGKSEAAGILKDEFGYSDVNSGRVLSELLGIPPVSKTPRRDFLDAAETFIRSTTGPAKLSRALAKQVRTCSGNVLIDGIRHKATLDLLRKELSPERISLLYIHSSIDIAHQLYQLREGLEISLDDFVAMRSAPVEREIERMIDLADGAIFNWIGLSEYREVVRTFANLYLISPKSEHARRGA